MSDTFGTTTFSYTPGGQLASENGPWASDSVSYAYTDRLRTALNLQQPSASAWVQNYGYDLAGRMTGLTSPAGTFSYSYNPGLAGTVSASSLVAKIALPNGAFITNTYDSNARMLGTWLYNSSASALDSSVYTNNVGNQRVSVTRNAENTAAFTYDLIGQVVGDVASEGPTNRMNEQLHYAFDPAGNLNYRTNNTLIENFQVNTVNELTSNTNGGKLTVVGTATSQNSTTVTVNSSNALVYGDATFAATNMPLVATYTAIAADSYGRHSTNAVSVNITTNTTYQYDGNGNLTNDGLRSFAYDDENQMIQVWVTSNWLSQFSYDGKMRRRIRQEFKWQSGAWVQTNAVYYVYDGNEVIQERNLNNLPTTTYTRGKDMSGSLVGAGGIGGLLSMTLNFEPGTLNSNSMYYHSDDNGNVTMLINGSQSIVARYLYDAFGNVLSKSGLLADANLYRFSSKETHLNSGLVYYLYRYYDPNLQRWPNRDPLSEPGFETLHLVNQPLFIRKLRFAINDSEMRFLLGMAIQSGSINVGAYLRNSHTPYRGNGISVSAFFNKLRNEQDAYAPNWPAELLRNPNQFDFVGNDPLDGIDPSGLSWYNPWSWGIWDNLGESVWTAIQYIAPAGEGEGAGAAACAGDLYKIETNQPPKIRFGNDPVNNPVPPTAG